MGREPGGFDHVPRDIACVVLCVVLIIEFLEKVFLELTVGHSGLTELLAVTVSSNQCSEYWQQGDFLSTR